MDISTQPSPIDLQKKFQEICQSHFKTNFKFKSKEKTFPEVTPTQNLKSPETPSTTSEQNKIIQAPPHIHMHVNAAPGSGKTTTMILRIIYLIQHYSVSPSEICFLTYNKFLSEDIHAKLRQYSMDPHQLGWCGTLHALCYRETQKYGDLTPWIQNHLGDVQVYPHLKYIFFDEYQDADPQIAQVVEILSRQKFLTIVGDERQQIYSYKGANARLLLNLRSNFQKFSLSESFRCNQNICRLLSRLFPKYPTIRSRIPGPRPVFYRSTSRSMNNPKVLEEIVRIVQTHKSGSVAILSPAVHSAASSKFMNDIHSNLESRCQIKFLCQLEDVHLSSSESSGNIMTSIHGVKGKEYDTVIMLNVIDNDYFYNYPSMEALCKLFVGLSRARQNLYIFEHRYHFSNGSLPWMIENEDLMDHPSKWIQKPQRRNLDFLKQPLRKSCFEYVRSCSPKVRNRVFSDYSSPELIFEETGLGQHYGAPELSGRLIETLLAIKYLKIVPQFRFEIYLNNQEWTELNQGKRVPSFEKNLSLVYPFPVRLNALRGHRSLEIYTQDGQFLSEVNEKSVVSSLIYQEYYHYLPTAQSLFKKLTNDLSSENIQNIWWILRFLKLARLSLVGFNRPDLSLEEISQIQNYIQNCSGLASLKPTHYHSFTRGLIQVSDEEPVCISGEIDFETDNSLIEVKCYTGSKNLEEAWLQVMIYHRLLGKSISALYVYNAITGQLWKRNLLSLIQK